MTGDASGVGPTERISAAELTSHQADTRAMRSARQVASREAFTTAVEESFNPFSEIEKMDKKALEHRTPDVKEEMKEHLKKVHEKRDSDEYAQQRQGRNPEMDAERLKQLRQLFLAKAGGGTAEEALADVRSAFNDPSLADEALDFLLETTEGEVADKALQAKKLLNEQMGQEVRAGRNMGAESRRYKALGTPEELRGYYRDIIGNPREGNKLFNEMSDKWDFGELKNVIKFLFESLGSDLRSKGPSIARGELYRLTTETRVLQAILGVYYFFKKRERLVRKQFAQKGIPVPEEIGFERLAEQFMGLIEEKYPTATKALRLAQELALEEEILGQIIVLSQYRDGTREVAPRLYRSLQHRYDLLMALVEALEELEDALEDEEEEGQEEENGDV